MSASVVNQVIAKPGRFIVKKFNVIIANDDRTPFIFVVDVLKSLFDYDAIEAVKMTRTIHTSGSAIVATYPADIAHDKVAKALVMSMSAGYNLQVSAEEANE